MKIRRLLAVAAVSALALGMLPAHASTDSATYTAGEALVANNAPGGQKVGIGGYKFGPKATRYTSIHVADVTGLNDIEVLVCNSACTVAGHQQGYCTNGSGNVSLATQGNIASDTLIVNVIVTPSGLFVGDQPCGGVGTTGTLTVTY